jgi:hypothetical protein
VRYFRTLVQAANAFVNAPAPFRQIVYDDGCTARELDENRALGQESAVCGNSSARCHK